MFFCICTKILKFCVNSRFDKLKLPHLFVLLRIIYLSIYFLLECGDMNTIYVLEAPPGVKCSLTQGRVNLL